MKKLIVALVAAACLAVGSSFAHHGRACGSCHQKAASSCSSCDRCQHTYQECPRVCCEKTVCHQVRMKPCYEKYTTCNAVCPPGTVEVNREDGRMKVENVAVPVEAGHYVEGAAGAKSATAGEYVVRNSKFEATR